MKNEITLASLADKINDKVKCIIVDSLPQEAIDNLIKKEFEYLFTSVANSNYYNDPITGVNGQHRHSQFQLLVRKEMFNQIQEKVKESISKQLAQIPWGYDATNEVMKSLIEELTPSAIQGMGKLVVGNILQDLKNRGY